MSRPDQRRATDGLCACKSKSLAICTIVTLGADGQSDLHVTRPQNAIVQQLFLVMQFHCVDPSHKVTFATATSGTYTCFHMVRQKRPAAPVCRHSIQLQVTNGINV